MKYTVSAKSDFGKCEYDNETVKFTAEKPSADARFFLDVDFPEWEEDCYILIPACAYNGNRFKMVERPYPPMYLADEVGENAEHQIMRGIPTLGKDGKGKLECSVADAASPIIGIFNRHSKEAFFLFTEQQVKEKNIGYSIVGGKITVQFPQKRDYAYRHALTPDRNPDKGISIKAGDEISTKVLIRSYPCKDIPEFYDIFMNVRKLLMSAPRPENGYTPELWKVMEAHFNDHNFSGKYYGNTLWITWQTGWTGGGMSSYPLYMLGDDRTKERAIQTLDFMTSFITPAGLISPVVYAGEEMRDDSQYRQLRGKESREDYAHMQGAYLVRRAGDILIFLIKQFKSPMPIKQSWVDAARGVADAMVKVFKKYGTFGQFIHQDTLEMLYGKSSSGASVVGGLAMASDYFNCDEYMEIAKAAGEFYYQNFVSEGITNGGPGEAMTAPDSESSYAFVESYVILYELTGDEKWLKYAKDAANLFSSWVMTYKFKFPEGKEFARLDINTLGSVFANVQNKHSAPGICTFSGDTMYRLYKHTCDERYLELIKDIAYFMPQCISTDERPIYDWDHEYGDPNGKLPAGYICERVNTSDWEYDQCVGGVFNVSCWCETSVILTFLELMDKEEMK